jgi:uncharacterized protein YbgA (DUF1722 family)
MNLTLFIDPQTEGEGTLEDTRMRLKKWFVQFHYAYIARRRRAQFFVKVMGRFHLLKKG